MNCTQILRLTGAAVTSIFIVSCAPEPAPDDSFQALEVVEPRPDVYADFTLTADLSDAILVKANLAGADPH